MVCMTAESLSASGALPPVVPDWLGRLCHHALVEVTTESLHDIQGADHGRITALKNEVAGVHSTSVSAPCGSRFELDIS